MWRCTQLWEFQELRLDDCRFQRYLRLTNGQFDDLMSFGRAGNCWMKTTYRCSISAVQHLSICQCCMAVEMGWHRSSHQSDWQQDLFKKASKENEAAVEASYVLSEMIAKPFKEGEFIKKCILLAASKVCPEKKGQFSNISLSANTVAERSSDLSENIYDQLHEKAKRFCAYSVALDESTDNTDTAQLAVYVRGVDDNFEVTEELLAVIPMHGQTTAKEIFLQLCGSIEDAGLPWKRFAGITTDGAPSMTGRKNGLVELVQRKLEEKNVEEAIALHCIIHQQALCGKCLRFDNVMSVVVKCINNIRSRGLKHRQFRCNRGNRVRI
ncbi:hypothetical protein F2P81_007505 [Scophthalmus maximus]|uniref:Uncharacterized protein n=1 Tax=Scophthalmus maximus TaxID=52904 RepID=A0A6A4T5J6_SCOMX|nr:hypothetical protein F2P81_007505 [Scophthalmus maximus]